jgi:hypothetical protein
MDSSRSVWDGHGSLPTRSGSSSRQFCAPETGPSRAPGAQLEGHHRNCHADVRRPARALRAQPPEAVLLASGLSIQASRDPTPAIDPSGLVSRAEVNVVRDAEG